MHSWLTERKFDFLGPRENFTWRAPPLFKPVSPLIVAVSTHGVDEVEEGSGGSIEVGGEAILFFSKNFSFLVASLLKTLGDFFFNLDPWLECPVRLVEEKSAEKLNLEPPRLTSRAAFPAFSSVMYLARSKHLSKIKGGKNGVNVDMVESSNQSVVERFLDLSHFA